MPEDYGILWVWLSIACGAGSRSADLLLDNFGSSIRDIYEAGEEDYRQIPELPRRTAEKLCGKVSPRGSGGRCLLPQRGCGDHHAGFSALPGKAGEDNEPPACALLPRDTARS